MRASDLGIRIGSGTRGHYNAITDVPGVRVGHSTINRIEGHASIHTGVTIIEPRSGMAREAPCFAGVHVLNGNGDATGLEWIREAGLLTTPIAFTNTHSVGVVRDALVAAERPLIGESRYWCMPVVLETYDGTLNDIWGQHVQGKHVIEAMGSAVSGRVEEGSVGGGTGMICHEFKGGIGTASRVLQTADGTWTVGAIVQANYGKREFLRVAGFPVGRILPKDRTPLLDRRLGTPGMGSIAVALATDAPLLPHQCQRLAQRATVGLARAGGGTEDSSGDIFVAFSTGNSDLPRTDYATIGSPTETVQMVNNDHISGLFVAAADAVEEAILNALLAAKSFQGMEPHIEEIGHLRLINALAQLGWQPD